MKNLIVAVLWSLSFTPAFAQGRGGAPQATPPANDSTPRVETAGEKEEKISQTSHAIRLDGREIKYTATTGTLPIRLDNGQVSARMFFVAYTKDGEDAKTRPVSFLYNGGPGAATIWLHMGSFAPKRVQMADEGFQPAPPYKLMGGAEYNFAHLGYDPTFTSRVSFTYYEAGHMIYIRPSEHKKLKNDIAKFIQGANAARPSSTSQP